MKRAEAAPHRQTVIATEQPELRRIAVVALAKKTGLCGQTVAIDIEQVVRPRRDMDPLYGLERHRRVGRHLRALTQLQKFDDGEGIISALKPKLI